MSGTVSWMHKDGFSHSRAEPQACSRFSNCRMQDHDELLQVMSRLGWNFQGPEWYCSGRWLPMDIPLHTLMLFAGLVALAEAGCTFPLPFAGFTWNVYGVLSLQTRSGMLVLRANLILFYFEGLYYHISKRASAIRYVFIGKASNQRSRYQILGVFLLIQLCVIAAEALRRWNKRACNMTLKSEATCLMELD
ncbi:hypothetical protein KIW84_023668 [Lathyrus oleraceus]|uniref:RING-type E3 ubiquitin transferase n=1 Tax=Pisum sativum TaxID=3888 RepID=A0A9D4YEF4_PEA|nr:hypothetical protein KIW84_023668 [Pisum sativum]